MTRLDHDRMLAIVRRHLPRGWTVCERDENTVQDRGGCYYNTKRIAVPLLVDRNALYVALHECAHARLHAGPDVAKHVEEYEAEQLAIALMRVEGVSVPRQEIRDARENVRNKIDEDAKKGWAIDPVIRAWAHR